MNLHDGRSTRTHASHPIASLPIASLPIAFLAIPLLAVCLALAACAPEGEAGAPPSEISQAELLARPGGGASPLLLDVRTPREYAGGHVPGAVNIPHNELAGRLGELSRGKDKEIVVYCESGKRAGMAATTLRAAGFTGVRHLTGDMSGWRNAQLPTETGAGPAR